jgi:hypothetical protein
VRILAKKPKYVEVDGEYIVPIRLSEDLTHKLFSGWWPMGFGWARLQPRDDGSNDLFVRTSEIRQDLNLVNLESVQQALMAALDLATAIAEDEEVFDEAVENGAQEVLRLIQRVAS